VNQKKQNPKSGHQARSESRSTTRKISGMKVTVHKYLQDYFERSAS
jgi:hypothetical protein